MKSVDENKLLGLIEDNSNKNTLISTSLKDFLREKVKELLQDHEIIECPHCNNKIFFKREKENVLEKLKVEKHIENKKISRNLLTGDDKPENYFKKWDKEHLKAKIEEGMTAEEYGGTYGRTIHSVQCAISTYGLRELYNKIHRLPVLTKKLLTKNEWITVFKNFKTTDEIIKYTGCSRKHVWTMKAKLRRENILEPQESINKREAEEWVNLFTCYSYKRIEKITGKSRHYIRNKFYQLKKKGLLTSRKKPVKSVSSIKRVKGLNEEAWIKLLTSRKSNKEIQEETGQKLSSIHNKRWLYKKQGKLTKISREESI